MAGFDRGSLSLFAVRSDKKSPNQETGLRTLNDTKLILYDLRGSLSHAHFGPIWYHSDASNQFLGIFLLFLTSRPERPMYKLKILSNYSGDRIKVQKNLNPVDLSLENDRNNEILELFQLQRYFKK